MELKLDNMLQVAEIVEALEKQIKYNIDYCNYTAYKAVIFIYNQFKQRYSEYLNFNY